MAACLLLGAVLGLCDVLMAAAVWRVLAKSAQRSRTVRNLGAVAGAMAGGLLTDPQLECVVIHVLGLQSEAAGLTMAFTYPFSLPVMTGMGAWLLAELVGGRSFRPSRSALYCCLGALLGAALLFGPAFFLPIRLPFSLSRSVWQATTLTVTGAGALLGLALAARHESHSA